MAAYPHYPPNIPFKPAPSLVSLLITKFSLFVLVMLGFVGFPIFLDAGSDLLVRGSIVAGFLVIIAIFVIWARRYYVSMWYELREDEISWKRGVWFRTTGIVPYNRITNLDIRQGPLMRMFGMSTLALQTAGYSGKAVPEIQIEGQIHADELRELIRFMVRGNTAHSDGTGGASPAKVPLTLNEQVLAELVKIRILLEQQGP